MGRINKKDKRLMLVSRLLFVMYMVLALYFLLVSEGFRRTAGEKYRYNLSLFAEIQRFYGMLNGSLKFKAVINLFGNVLCFVPFGIFVPYIFSKRLSFIKVVTMTFLFSLCVEIVQLLFKIGIFDVDDLLLNTIGGAIGYIVYKVVYLLRHI